MTARPTKPGGQPPPPSAASPKKPRRKGWIRWPGVVVFLVLVLGLGGIWVLLVDAAMKRLIERTGTALVGAKVELDAADLSLFPLGLTLTRLQVTNPEAPMTNAVEIARIAFTMDGLNLLRRKVLIEELAAERIRLNTPRTSSGAVAKPVKKAPDSQAELLAGVKLPPLQLRDPRDILKHEAIESLKLVESVRADVAGAKDRWQKQLAALPDKAKFDGYKKRLEGLKSAGKGGLGGILGGASDALAIQEDLKRDLEQLQAVKKEFEGSVTLLRKRVEEVQQAPQADFRRLRDKYAISPQGLANLSAAVLGGPLGEWTRTGLRWYRKLQPVLMRNAERKAEVEVVTPLRGAGVDVRFKEVAPRPDFLIRTARVSLEIPQGTIKGVVRNITPDQDVLGAPLTLELAGEQLQGLQAAKLTGTFSRVHPTSPKDEVQLLARGVSLGSLTLAAGTDLPLTLQQGSADLDLQATVAGQALDAGLSARLQSLQIASGAKADAGALQQAIQAALADVHGFSVKAGITGTLDQYEVQLSSDLDRVLQEAVGKQIQAQLAKFEAQLQAAIMEQVGGPLAELRGSLGGLDGIAAELAGRLNLGKNLLHLAKPGGGGAPGGFALPF
ncbi:TIGR03545 family protein [Nitrospira sp. Kam-Ns4a]